jgi:glycine cleavage system H protein
MIPDNHLFTEEHEWLSLHDDGTATIGVSDFAQEQLGEVVFVELPEVGEKVVAGDEFGSIESVKASTELYCPVSGEVIEVNSSLSESPEFVNESPYDDGWMIKVKLEDLSETHGLMDSEAYGFHIQRSDNKMDELDDLDDEETEED